MNMIKLNTFKKTLLADTLTPVSIYLRLRDRYAKSILLESSDYHGQDNSFSYICCDPIASFVVKGSQLSITLPNGEVETRDHLGKVIEELEDFRNSFSVEDNSNGHISNGLFGYMAYQAVEFYEDIHLTQKGEEIPDVYYSLFRYVIAVDHFKNQMHIYEHVPENTESNLNPFISVMRNGSFPSYGFKIVSEEKSNFTDEGFVDVVKGCIEHCKRGDVFQIVPSRRFENEFRGDDFNVYRALRSVNPSPYLFYFDFGSFKIFGSSPEAQIVIKNDVASIFPIAGTFKRTGDDQADKELAEKLIGDQKENSEHVMLVDLARNDLSINSDQVVVDVFKEIQFYSHVIHLVSKVTGKLRKNINPLQLVADTFPAGTLSGAPKHNAMKLIDSFETTPRLFYGGAIGFMGFNQDFNHAIMIRSFLSRKNTLVYQAGAGVVSQSIPESELNEVNNKLMALRSALKLAETIQD